MEISFCFKTEYEYGVYDEILDLNYLIKKFMKYLKSVYDKIFGKNKNKNLDREHFYKLFELGIEKPSENLIENVYNRIERLLGMNSPEIIFEIGNDKNFVKFVYDLYDEIQELNEMYIKKIVIKLNEDK